MRWLSLLVIGAPALVVLSALWRGYVLSLLWAWFVVPVFGAPPLGIPAALGLSLLVAALTAQHMRIGTPKDLGYAMGVALLAPPATLLFGWIIKHFL